MGDLNGVGRLLPDPELLLMPLQRNETLKSSSLEGTHATPQELLLYELDRAAAGGSEERLNTWREVSNYRAALMQGTRHLEENTLSLALVRMLHQLLLSGVRGEEKNPGEFRDRQVFIGANRRFVPPPPEHVQACLDSLEQAMRSSPVEADPLVHCLLFHYQFECIHPFRDGNGRVGRLLLALMIWKACGLTQPWLYLSPFFERNKAEYIDKLSNISSRGDWTSWVEFCLIGVIEEAAAGVSKCERLRQLQLEFYQVTQHKARLAGIIDMLFQNPFCVATEVMERFAISRPTALADLQYLEELGVLQRLDSKEKQYVYYCPAIYSIAFPS